jgi:hypothetical protein
MFVMLSNLLFVGKELVKKRVATTHAKITSIELFLG